MNLERDTGRSDALRGYLITPIVRRSLARILAGLESGATERAWTLTGPYGSGKTAFAVFLASLLRRDQSPLRNAAHAVLKESDLALVRSLKKTALLPVILTGERAPLDLLVIRALKAALEEAWATRRGPRPAVFSEIQRLADRLNGARNGCLTSEVVAAFAKAARVVAETFGLGLLLVVDEAGKTLEYAAQNPTRGDVHAYQALAELAAGTQDAPFVMITVLHQAFDEYAVRLAANQRNEWTKVQGRFTDLIFQEEPDQIVRLTGAALEPIQQRPQMAEWSELVEVVARTVSQGTGWDKKVLAKNLDRCWPLHPVTAVLLGPLFRGKLAQNERSLFAFLSSGEPLGFHEFLTSQTVTALYTPDRLYDYVLGALGSAIFGRDGKLWAEIDTALRRLPPEAEAVDAKWQVSDELAAVLEVSAGRAMVQMPTGSGKTRTVMDAITRRLRLSRNAEPFLWLAHSEELCEQAVGTFKRSWIHGGIGAVRVCRAWGGHAPAAGDVRGGLVVAGLQKLVSLQKKRQHLYERLSTSCAAVVFDEAHKALAPTYLELLRDLLARSPKASLVGLTATPGRSATDLGQNRALAQLFENKLIRPDFGDQNPIEALREMRILSRLKRVPIESPTRFRLLESEKRFVEEFFDLPPSALQRVGEDAQRNLLIVATLVDLVRKSYPTIVFACSVEHAKVIAALATLNGARACSVTSDMTSGARASCINGFRIGEYKAIVNFGVLSTGFDAPNTKAVMITRPTASVVLYSQMVGRGMRGPRVGGNEEALLVDIVDNIEGFGADREIFDFFSGYWN